MLVPRGVDYHDHQYGQQATAHRKSSLDASLDHFRNHTTGLIRTCPLWPRSRAPPAPEFTTVQALTLGNPIPIVAFPGVFCGYALSAQDPSCCAWQLAKPSRLWSKLTLALYSGSFRCHCALPFDFALHVPLQHLDALPTTSFKVSTPSALPTHRISTAPCAFTRPLPPLLPHFTSPTPTPIAGHCRQDHASSSIPSSPSLERHPCFLLHPDLDLIPPLHLLFLPSP